jgi:MYXO-CTERM domain-containing protein
LFVTLSLLAAAVAACDAGGGGSSSGPDATGALTGTLRSYVVDVRGGKSRRLRILELGDPVARRVRLAFTGDPDVAPGDRLRVWGDDRGDELVVGRFEKLAAANDRVVRGLTTVTPKTSRNAFVMVDVGGGVNLTTASANSTVFSPGKNFAGQYSLMSFGGEIYTGDVLGPFSYPMTSCDWDGLATAMRQKVPTGYDHYMWYMGSMVNACDWSGIGAEGSAAAPESDAWFNQATDCGTLVQEVGHNNGWMHSSTLKCSGAPFADNPATACTTDEYGNLYSPMGFGDCGHFVAMDKWYGGYFGGCNLVKVASTATLNLMPIEIPCNGIQGIQIAMPKTTRSYTAEQDDRPTALKYYYLELRVNGTPGETTLIKAPTVLVIVGDNLGATNRESTHTFLLDMNPSTNSYDGMTAAGQSFSDPAGGLMFSVVSIDKTQATIQVTYTNGSGAGPTCIDGTTLVGSGPIDCGGGTTGTGGAGGGAGSGGGAGGMGGASGGGRGGATGAAGRGGSGGNTGSAGTGGTTGAAGTTGMAGTTGSAGTTGTAGTTGGGGTTGAAGTTGGTGTPGTAGSIGPGIAGATGAGTGGSMSTGGQTTVTGVGGAQAGGSSGEKAGPIVGGCACSAAPQGTGMPSLVWIALGAVAAGRRRRALSRR